MLITATTSIAGWGPPPSYSPPATLVTGLEIKLEHLTELRSAVNQLRSHAGLSNFIFTVDPEPQRYVTEVKADHILQLRTALEQARTQLGLSIGGYEHPDLHTGDPIYATDFQELRNQVSSAWNSGTGGLDIRWLVADQLGTPRMIFDQSGSLTVTDQNGNYVSGMTRHDYLPFGEELFAGTGGRLTTMGYTNSDGARQKFTQKERDTETGLDYFGARYYGSIQGRFTSADSFAGSPANPQSLNRYSYVVNNPLNLNDPTGHFGQDPKGGTCSPNTPCTIADPNQLRPEDALIVERVTVPSAPPPTEPIQTTDTPLAISLSPGPIRTSPPTPTANGGESGGMMSSAVNYLQRNLPNFVGLTGGGQAGVVGGGDGVFGTGSVYGGYFASDVLSGLHTGVSYGGFFDRSLHNAGLILAGGLGPGAVISNARNEGELNGDGRAYILATPTAWGAELDLSTNKRNEMIYTLNVTWGKSYGLGVVTSPIHSRRGPTFPPGFPLF